MATSTKPMEVSLKIALPLSVLMVILASAGLKEPYYEPDGPVLSMFRNETSGLPFYFDRENSYRAQPYKGFVYRYLHISVAIAWSILMPFQHIASVRTRYPAFHRICGRIALACSLFLGVSGMWFPSAGLTHSHVNLFHIHTFYNIPFLVWPTFDAGVYIGGPPILFSLVKTIQTARAKQYAQHRQWAVIHTIMGYGISLNRVALLAVLGIGKLLTVLPEKFRTEFLYVPTKKKDMAAVEMSAFALMVWSAYLMAGCWLCAEYARAGSVFGRWTVPLKKQI